MDFAARLTAWQQRHGRHGLPWQGTRDPYAVWLSEIMLQQTQVATVIPYYRRFLARFPDIDALAAADEDEVLALWSGLGYYSRGRNLHRAARLIVERHGGEFPREFAEIQALPGIGRSTAAAVAAFAFGRRCAILDGNVKRVLTRCFGIEGYPGDKKVENALWALAESLLPPDGIASYIQGLMDLGATLCTRGKPRCADCPLDGLCVARREGRSAELPQRKARPALPEKRTAMLVLLNGGEILLEKRPPTGIWGGAVEPAGNRPGCRPGAGGAGVLRRRGAGFRGVAGNPTCVHAFPAGNPPAAEPWPDLAPSGAPGSGGLAGSARCPGGRLARAGA